MFPEHNDTATMIPAAHGDRNDEMLQKNKMLQKNIFLFSCNKRTPYRVICMNEEQLSITDKTGGYGGSLGPRPLLP